MRAAVLLEDHRSGWDFSEECRVEKENFSSLARIPTSGFFIGGPAQALAPMCASSAAMGSGMFGRFAKNGAFAGICGSMAGESALNFSPWDGIEPDPNGSGATVPDAHQFFCLSFP